MASFLSDFAYLLMVLLDLMALFLILEWFFYFMPGAPLNGIRKVFFYLTYPLLGWSDRFFSIRLGLFNSRGLLTALLLLVIGYLGMPWLILFSYSLRG
ncbi:MAG TPA: hypothetical protein VN963_05685 [bacterium]|nr:hypothetical protein [bacterium]